MTDHATSVAGQLDVDEVLALVIRDDRPPGAGGVARRARRLCLERLARPRVAR